MHGIGPREPGLFYSIVCVYVYNSKSIMHEHWSGSCDTHLLVFQLENILQKEESGKQMPRLFPYFNSKAHERTNEQVRQRHRERDWIEYYVKVLRFIFAPILLHIIPSERVHLVFYCACRSKSSVCRNELMVLRQNFLPYVVI